MKCPECAHGQKVKYGLKCGGCGYAFSFNPKVKLTAGLTDGKFKAAIHRASQNGTSFFTANQLYAAYASKIPSPGRAVAVLSIIIGVVGLGALLIDRFAGFMFLAFASIVFALSRFAKAPVLSHKSFEAAVHKWLSDGKPIPSLLREPSLHTPPEDWSEHDIYDYGVERILIVQRDLIVDLMVRNNQHAEQRMLVISEQGYPNYLIEHVNRLLAQRSDLPVFLLHDADASGAAMAQRVNSLAWLQLGDQPVIDMGFFTNDFEKLKRTKNFENQQSERALPADALLIGSLALGMGACFASQSTFADELLREHRNQMDSGSSFG